ncbi:MAG: alpha-L-fucosidase [Dehalococcoidia bacterium]|nr:MAG: alpha-L-fucosidase [Dehalococcoidia bacterium]
MVRRLIIACFIWLLIVPTSLSCCPVNTPSNTVREYTGDNFTNWDDARLGIFVHWSHSSQQGVELSWPMVGGTSTMPYCQNMTVEQYQSSAATFNPQKWDPVALAKLFKKAGAQYTVIITQHCDGYAMFDSKLNDFGVMHSPIGRDLVREYVDAVRAEGMGVGLYYTLADWYHPDYPAVTEADKPYHYYMGAPLPPPEQWQRYLDFVFGQVREILTNYGKIDEIWFDSQWEHKAADWKPKELAEMVRSLQPGIKINDRLPGQGDFDTPEKFLPAVPPKRAWETCMTMNDSWGYNKDDPSYKSSTEIIQTLCEIAGKGGHLLLNVSPMGDGQLPPEQIQRLNDMAAWMALNHESITGTKPGLESWQFYGPSTQKDNTIYLHLLSKPYESITVRSVHVNKVKSVRVLGSGKELQFTKRVTLLDQVRKELMNFNDPVGDLVVIVPESVIEPHATVIAIEMNP